VAQCSNHRARPDTKQTQRPNHSVKSVPFCFFLFQRYATSTRVQVAVVLSDTPAHHNHPRDTSLPHRAASTLRHSYSYLHDRSALKRESTFRYLSVSQANGSSALRRDASACFEEGARLSILVPPRCVARVCLPPRRTSHLPPCKHHAAAADRSRGAWRKRPRQGLTLVHFSAQLERFVWDRGCA
jgi:hypothetical protein